VTLTLYSRPGCHLCEEMKAIIEKVAASEPIDLREVDVSGDPDLERRYGLEIPVLEIDGQKIAKYRIDERALRSAIRARAQGAH
jgi:glutaredoxin